MESVAGRNRASWDAYADEYAARSHTEPVLERLARDPASAFHRTTLALIREAVPDFTGKRVLVPSSGDNKAAFAFALMGAEVTSADISQRQLENAKKAAERIGLHDIRFVRTDTMTLEGIGDETFDLVYTSNGVHVWIDDLDGMYRNIVRVLKPGGKYALFELHPFNRPLDDDARIVKPYDAIGPMESGGEVNFHWRLMDILSAMLRAGLVLWRFEEMAAEKSYEDPFWVPFSEQVKEGYREYDRAEVDALYDWRTNPMAALPQWFFRACEEGMSTIEVRRATLDDVPAIVEIETGEEGPWGAPDSCHAWTALRLERGFTIQIATLDGEPAGHAEWIESDEPAGKTFYLGVLQVKKSLQHRGVGRAMLACGEAEAWRRNCITLSTMPETDTGSEVFYAKCGFQNARYVTELAADALDMGVVIREVPSVAESVVREMRFVAGLRQFASRHMYEVLFHPPEGSGRITRCAEFMGGYVALDRFRDDARAQASAWGDFTAPEALRAALTFAARIGVPGIEFVFDAAEKDAVAALGLGAFADNAYYEMIKRLR